MKVIRIVPISLALLSLVPGPTGCGGSAPATVAAATSRALSCNQPSVFRGADDGLQSFAVGILCNATNVPTTGGFLAAEGTYTLQNAYAISQITTWLGTAQNSIEETAGEITLEEPTRTAGVFKTVAIITNQKDKHQDVEGERIEHFNNGIYHLPAGSRIHFFMNIGLINPASNCPLGCGVQLNVYMNTPAS